MKCEHKLEVNFGNFALLETPQARTLLRDALKYKLMTHSVQLTTDHMERANKRPVPIYASTTQKPRK